MKETKLTKRIFAVFVAFIVILLISCGDLQVFAENITCYLSVTRAYTTSATPTLYNADGSVIYQGNSLSSTAYTVNKDQEYIYISIYSNDWSVVLNGTQSNYTSRGNYYLDLDVSSLTSFTLRIITRANYSGNNACRVYIRFNNTTPTPEPTPIPEPTPTPEPTFAPDQPTYYTFFNHLLNDGNNALNALYLSWTQANNKFYTGIFFIGLPIMIGIFGIVASIFFGGDD